MRADQANSALAGEKAQEQGSTSPENPSIKPIGETASLNSSTVRPRDERDPTVTVKPFLLNPELMIAPPPARKIAHPSRSFCDFKSSRSNDASCAKRPDSLKRTQLNKNALRQESVHFCQDLVKRVRNGPQITKEIIADPLSAFRTWIEKRHTPSFIIFYCVYLYDHILYACAAIYLQGNGSLVPAHGTPYWIAIPPGGARAAFLLPAIIIEPTKDTNGPAKAVFCKISPHFCNHPETPDYIMWLRPLTVTKSAQQVWSLRKYEGLPVGLIDLRSYFASFEESHPQPPYSPNGLADNFVRSMVHLYSIKERI